MLTRADLDEAVRNGIITQQLSAVRPAARHRHAQGDERFIFMKSFNEFFIALGVVLLGVGLWAAAGAFPHFAIAFPIIFIAVMWALAEFLTRRLKLTLPSIVLAIFIVTTLAFLLKDSLSDSSSLLIASFSAALSALLFYLRFQSASGALENPARLKLAKREIARILTVRNEREFAKETGG